MSKVEGASAVRQERKDVSGKPALITGLCVIVVGLLAVGVMTWMLVAQRGSVRDGGAKAALPAKATVVEQSRIERTAAGLDLQEQARRRLDSWGWVERGKVAHIPIHEASRWLVQDAERGRLEWPTQAAAQEFADLPESLATQSSPQRPAQQRETTDQAAPQQSGSPNHKANRRASKPQGSNPRPGAQP